MTKTATDNPLLAEWMKHNPPSNRQPGGCPYTPFSRRPVDSIVSAAMARGEACHRYAWAVPDPTSLAMVAALSPLIEIGAGTGYWAGLLTKAGADVVAYDSAPPGDRLCGVVNHWHPGRELFHPVRAGGPEALIIHRDRTLFVCWPPYNDPMGADCLYGYRGQRFVYVGEGPGGCTGDDTFHDAVERDWEEETSLMLPQWPGIHDELVIYRRRT